MSYPDLAGQRDDTSAAALQLFTGDTPLASDSAPALANIAQYQVCVILATGITPYVPATHTTAAPDKLVIAQHAATTGQQANYWSGGHFNHAVLGWPASLDTFLKRREAFQGGLIQIGHLNP